MKTLTRYLAIAAASLGLASSASAVPTLWLWDNVNDVGVTITDGGAGDTIGLSNFVGFNGSVGDWTLSISTGIILGTSSQPQLQLQTSSTSSKAGQLVIYISDNDFGPSDGGVATSASVTSTTNGTVQYASLVETSNDVIDGVSFTGYYLTYWGSNLDSFSGSETSYSSIDEAGPYGLGLALAVNHTGAGSTGASAGLTVPDSGMTGLLVGLGLLGLAASRRFRRA